MPTLLVILVLVIGHVIWLQYPSASGVGTYSPLMILLYGYWLVVLNLAANLVAAFYVRKPK